jgi:hypothetical protein
MANRPNWEETMRRIIVAALIAILALQAAPSLAERDRMVRRERHGRVVTRTRVVVHRGFPIHRNLPVVVVRRHPVVLTERIVYGAPLLWAGLVVPLPARERLIWEDSETLDKSEGWTDVVLDVNGRGERLFLELTGRTQIGFAEVVFGNDEARVVDFNEGTRKPGIYDLLDFRGGRDVRYVRLVARAMEPTVRVIVRMER